MAYAFLTKFNDPNGDVHQQTCQNDCDIVDYKTGTGRMDMMNVEFDVYYQSDVSGCFTVDGCPVKCVSCPYLLAHVTV